MKWERPRSMMILRSPTWRDPNWSVVPFAKASWMKSWTTLNIPTRMAAPGARGGIVQPYRRPWLDRGIEPLSERKAGPLGKVVLSQPMPAACPALRMVKVRTNRDVVLSWTAEAVMPRVKEGARRSTDRVGVDGTSRFPFLSVAVHWVWMVIERPSAMPRRTTRCAVRECGPGARFDQVTWNPSDTFVTGKFSSM